MAALHVGKLRLRGVQACSEVIRGAGTLYWVSLSTWSQQLKERGALDGRAGVCLPRTVELSL